MELAIRFAETETEREAIYRLRYTIYVEELGGVSDPCADHTRRWYGEGGVRNSRLLYATVGETIVATLRLQLGADDALGEEEAIIYELARFAGAVSHNEICVLSRFMALPAYRNGPIPQLMLQAMYRFCVEQGVMICFLDCRPHLLNLYNSLGFRAYCRPYSEPSYGLLVPMALLICDRAHLMAVGSPFLPDAPAITQDSQTAAIVEILQAALTAVLPSETALSVDGLAYVAGLADEVRSPVALFAGLSEAETARVIARGHILTCRSGDKLIIEGDVEHTMFLILQGHVEAHIGGEVVAVEGPGSIVGEVAYLLGVARTADIVAGVDGARVLYLRYRTLEELMEGEPHLAARLLLNISRIIATKFLAKYRS